MSLIIFFLVKEGGFFTALAACCLVGTLFSIIVAVMKVVLYGFGLCTSKTRAEKLADTIERALWTQLSVLWHMCVNLSTAHRIIALIGAMLSGKLNASIKVCDSLL